jgi:Zn-dependent protease with chaperone function
MYLPPVTLAEARSVYALLRVTPAEIRLDRLYAHLYFASEFLHLVVWLVFLAFGFSALFRNYSDRLAPRLLRLGLVQRLFGLFRCFKAAFLLIGLPLDKLTSTFGKTWLGRVFGKYKSLWNPQLLRSAFIYYLFYTIVFTLFWSPLSYFEDFVLPHRYGLSHETFLDWLGDVGKDTCVSAVFGATVAALIVWGIAIFPKRWPFVFAVWSLPLIFIGIFLDPLTSQIDNKLTPLPVSSPLYIPLHNLAARAGVPNADILVADKSKQTEETNAYVTGLGSSAQIVLWDTLIKRMKPDEVVAVTGHELGHYVHHDVIVGGSLAGLALFVFFPVLKLTSDWLLRWFGAAWKVHSLADPAALPILIISLSVLSFLTSPVYNAVSRVVEHRADSYGLAITGNRLAMARAEVDLDNENLEDPYPPAWEVFWLDDHPPSGERIRFALYGQPMSVR